MSIDLGAVPITGFISPTDNTDVYPTHTDIFGKGGYRAVDTTEARDSISADRRSLGMLVYVIFDNTVYQLKTGLLNSDWVVIDFTTGSTLLLPEDYIFLGDANGVAQPSAALIDVQLDLILANTKFNTIADAHVILTQPNSFFTNANVLGLSNIPEYMFVENGAVNTTTIIPFSGFPNIIEDHILFGDFNNRPIERKVIGLINMPPLLQGRIWKGDALHRPIEVVLELNTIPNNGNIDFNNYNGINLADPVNLQDAATKNYVDAEIANSAGNITLEGFVSGGVPVNDVITTIRTPGDLDMQEDRVINLNQSPEDGFDAISAQFLWDLMHDEVNVIWP